MKVLLASPQLGRRLNKLKDMVPDNIEIILPETELEDELLLLARDVEVIVCVHLSAKVVQSAKRLKFIQKIGAGVDAIPFDALRNDVIVANTSGANPRPLAEGTVALILALAKRIVQRHEDFKQGKRDSKRGIELRGKNVGIIGFGHIGVEVAKLLKVFGVKILALKRHPTKVLNPPFDIEFIGGPDELDYLLRESDFVVVTVPLTPETRGLIGERELRLMKSTAYIINVARAAIIDENSLYKALIENWIAGAALDVWWTPHWWDPSWNSRGEPPSKNPIWLLSNVIATPHNIVSTDTQSKASQQIIAENILRLSQGKIPLNQVDKVLHY